MIRRITGRLEGATETACEISVEATGLTYEVLLPRYLCEETLSRTGETVTLHTRQHLEAQGQGTSFIPRLIGFEAPADRAFFELLTSVKGLGARKALRALAIEPAQIARAIAARDAKALQKLPEIGKRLAETIIVELHGKVDAYLTPDETAALNDASIELRPAPSLPPAAEEAVSALMALGEHRESAERKVERARALVGADAGTDELVAAAFGQRAG
ncbi:MAG: Holliday junction branch migration protein RuvA [Phycisphaerales bacterium JB059]